MSVVVVCGVREYRYIQIVVISTLTLLRVVMLCCVVGRLDIRFFKQLLDNSSIYGTNTNHDNIACFLIIITLLYFLFSLALFR